MLYIYCLIHLAVGSDCSIMASAVPTLPQSFAPGIDSVFSDQSGFYSLDSNVPGLSKVILSKLDMKDYGEYRYLPQLPRWPF